MTDQPDHLAIRHHHIGWWCLAAFATLGLVLESMHGFKVAFYLDVTNETRRHMWTLAHAHGTLLALVNVGLAVALDRLGGWSPGRRALVSSSLLGATVLVPLGFFLGGVWIHDGDPGMGVLLVPLGALLMIVSAVGTAMAAKTD